MLTVPELGLDRVLGAWSGLGDLANDLSAVEVDGPTRDWTPRDVRKRALRVVLQALEPALADWPSSLRVWEEALPARSVRERLILSTPRGRVDWSRTRRRGWPPDAFVTQQRMRHYDIRSVGILSWTLDLLEEAQGAAIDLLGDDHRASLGEDVQQRLTVALELLGHLGEPDAAPPTPDELRALRREGAPWTAVAETASVLRRMLGPDVAELASRWLLPDPLFRDRLFHLACLGQLLLAIESVGATVVSKGPLAAGYNRPAFALTDSRGRSWDLWFEASQAWRHYGIDTAYAHLTRGLRSPTGAAFRSGLLRPDILLARHPYVALAFECKYPTVGEDPAYVAGGLPQAHFYSQQLRSNFQQTEGYVLGPAELIASGSARRLRGTRLGILDVYGASERVRALMS